MSFKPQLILGQEVRNDVGRLAWAGDKKEMIVVDDDKGTRPG
jgi:hypothetical protein